MQCPGLNNQYALRLDSFLVSQDWGDHLICLLQCVLLKPVSNHAISLLGEDRMRNGKI